MKSRQRWHCAGGTGANGAALCASTGAGCSGAAQQNARRARLTVLGLLSVRACACCSGGHHLYHHRDYHLPRNHLHGSAPHPSACLSQRAQRLCKPPRPSHLQPLVPHARTAATAAGAVADLTSYWAACQVTPIAVPIATVPVYYSTPVYYYDTSVSFCALCGCLQTLPAFSRFPFTCLPPCCVWRAARHSHEESEGVATGSQPRWSACLCTQSAGAHPLAYANRRECLVW
jgi:hypothetical protein